MFKYLKDINDSFNISTMLNLIWIFNNILRVVISNLLSPIINEKRFLCHNSRIWVRWFSFSSVIWFKLNVKSLQFILYNYESLLSNVSAAITFFPLKNAGQLLKLFFRLTVQYPVNVFKLSLFVVFSRLLFVKSLIISIFSMFIQLIPLQVFWLISDSIILEIFLLSSSD